MESGTGTRNHKFQLVDMFPRTPKVQKNGEYVPCGPKNRGYVPGATSANRQNRGYVPDRDFANRHEE